VNAARTQPGSGVAFRRQAVDEPDEFETARAVPVLEGLGDASSIKKKKKKKWIFAFR